MRQAAGHVPVVKKLMALGARRALKDNKNRTARNYARQRHSAKECVALLKALRYRKKKQRKGCVGARRLNHGEPAKAPPVV